MKFQIPSIPEPVQWVLLSPLILAAFPLVAVMGAMQMIHDKCAPYDLEYKPWFAWRPVRHFNDVDWFWFEMVERRRVGFFRAFHREPSPMTPANPVDKPTNRVENPSLDVRSYLIRKNGYFYRPDAAGYTSSVEQAGRYTLIEAIRHSHPNGPDGPRDGITYLHEADALLAQREKPND